MKTQEIDICDLSSGKKKIQNPTFFQMGLEVSTVGFFDMLNQMV